MKHRAFYLSCAGFLFLFAGLGFWPRSTSPGHMSSWTQADLETAVASGSGVAVPRTVLLNHLRSYGEFIPNQPVAKLRASVDILVGSELLAQEAFRRGLDRDPETRAAIVQVLGDRLKAQVLSEIKAAEIDIGEIADRYEAIRTQYVQPEAVRVAHLLLRMPIAAGRLQSILEQAKSYRRHSLHFGDLARDVSDDDMTKHKGGDLGLLTRGSDAVPAEVIDAAFGIKSVGEVAGPIRSPQGIHILRLTGRRPELARTFEEVKDEIRATLLQEKRRTAYAALLARLRQESPVEIHLDRLDTPSLFVTETAAHPELVSTK